MRVPLSLGLAFLLLACSPQNQSHESPSAGEPNQSHTAEDAVVRGSAIVTITSDDLSATSTATTNVVYSNSPSVNFQIDATTLVAGAMTGNTLNLGKISVVNLTDNDLKICGVNGKTKCTKAMIRIYTTGSIAGFVNTSDETNYGVPVYSGGLNPTTAITLGSPGVTLQQTSIDNTTHVLRLSNFTAPVFNITSDFSNAGAGQYSMTLVVEYALAL